MTTRWEYHCAIQPRALTAAELGELGQLGWECFSIFAASPDDPAVSHYFRRPIRYAAPPRLPPPTALKGGLGPGHGPGLGDMVGRYPDGAPIRIRR